MCTYTKEETDMDWTQKGVVNSTPYFFALLDIELLCVELN